MGCPSFGGGKGIITVLDYFTYTVLGKIIGDSSMMGVGTSFDIQETAQSTSILFGSYYLDGNNKIGSINRFDVMYVMKDASYQTT